MPPCPILFCPAPPAPAKGLMFNPCRPVPNGKLIHFFLFPSLVAHSLRRHILQNPTIAMKTSVLICALLAAAAMAADKHSIRKVPQAETGSKLFKPGKEQGTRTGGAAPKRLDPSRPFPDTPRTPDIAFIRAKVAMLVKHMHIDQDQADKVSRPQAYPFLRPRITVKTFWGGFGTGHRARDRTRDQRQPG